MGLSLHPSLSALAAGEPSPLPQPRPPAPPGGSGGFPGPDRTYYPPSLFCIGSAVLLLVEDSKNTLGGRCLECILIRCQNHNKWLLLAWSNDCTQRCCHLSEVPAGPTFYIFNQGCEKKTMLVVMAIEKKQKNKLLFSIT